MWSGFKSYEKYLFFLLIISAFLLVAFVHISYPEEFYYAVPEGIRVGSGMDFYPYPLHGDEWNHVAQAVYVMETGIFPSTNPYIKDYGSKVNLQSGFHFFLAQFFTLTGLDPVRHFWFLPALLAVISVLSLFALVLYLSRDFFSAFFSSLFFLGMANNTNIMGVWFLVPLSFSFFLVFLSLLAFQKKEKSFYLLLGLFFLTSLFTYPFAAILSFITITTLFIVENREKLLKSYKQVSYIAVMGAVGLAIALILFRGNISSLLHSLYFPYGWVTGFEHLYPLTSITGILPLIFSAAAILFMLAVKKLFENTKAFIVLAFLTGILVLSYTYLNFTIIIPYQRALIYLAISLAALGGIGLSYTITSLSHLVKKHFSSAQYFLQIIIITGIILTFFFSYNDYYEVEDERFKPLIFISEADYEALTWLEERHGTGNVVLANEITSFGVYPVSKNHVVGMPLSNLEGGDINAAREFFRADCATKEEIARSREIDFAYSHFPLDCEFLQETRAGETYIYLVVS